MNITPWSHHSYIVRMSLQCFHTTSLCDVPHFHSIIISTRNNEHSIFGKLTAPHLKRMRFDSLSSVILWMHNTVSRVIQNGYKSFSLVTWSNAKLVSNWNFSPQKRKKYIDFSWVNNVIDIPITSGNQLVVATGNWNVNLLFYLFKFLTIVSSFMVLISSLDSASHTLIVLS